MYPIALKHYVKYSYVSNPSFVILMSDNKEYISNSCVFMEATEDNIDNLIREYNCEAEIEELFKSDAVEFKDVEDFSWMFYRCTSLTSISIDTSAGKDFGAMLYGCTSLTSVSLDTREGEDFSWMFEGCTSLTSASLNTRAGKNFIGMFRGCTSLTSVSLDTSKGENFRGMFRGCHLLEEDNKKLFA